MAMRSEQRTQFLNDIVITALEGGVNYWADVHNYSWHDDDRGRIADVSADLIDLMDVEVGRGIEWHHIDP